ncbi:fibronectin type III domain-containing protein [Brumimicrobium aurantiacum]|uniref:T9SS C-terminal target domain-containing protein n=1 Tax=Brumimicrobium aurantiacum TaxID=1737063 RepID=A0A3E1EUY4_9FLAO|nr:fibronectin type III domain-containing protein [Brumimicrobium aurantiacum]RFC53386.1 T9SS C-terminal target domain-containing protein [Brumimicrobium aurantiacum]
MKKKFKSLVPYGIAMLFAATFSTSSYGQFGCGNGVVITDGYTQAGITTPGNGGVEDWNTDPTGTSVSSSYWQDDVYLFEYTAGTTIESISMEINSYNSWTGIGIFDDCSGTTFSNELDASASTVTGTQNVSAVISAGNTVYIAVGQYGAPNDLDFDVVDFSVTSITCPDPTSVVSSNIVQTGFDIDWTENGTATLWNIEVGASGFTPGTGNEVFADNGNTTQTSNVTGLNAVTTYDVYVQADCGSGDVSNWVGPLTITTLCPATQSIPYLEEYSSYLPNCWSETNGILGSSSSYTATSSTWGNDGFLNNGSSGAARLNIYGTSTDEWLISPTFDLGTSSNYELKFDVGLTDFSGSGTDNMGADDTLAVVISTDNGATWSKANILKLYEQGTEPSNSGETVIIDLSTYSGLVKFGFYGSSSVSNTDYNVYIDDFEVRTPPSCPEPTALTSSNVTDTSVDIDWTENGTASLWNIEVGASGFTPGTGNEVFADNGNTTQTSNVTGLNAVTAYDVYVQADCGSGDVSNWVGPLTITTLCPATQSIPYLEEYSSYLPNCWSETNGILGSSSSYTATSSTWGNDGFLNNGSSGAARLNIYGTSTDEWLISPTFDLGTSSNYELKFDVGLTDFSGSGTDNMGADDTLAVVISTDNGATWSKANILKLYEQGTEPSNSGETVIIDLSTYSGLVKFGFYGSSSVSNTDYNVYIDDFEVRTQPSCPAPLNLALTDISSTTAEFSWTTGGAAQSEIVVVPAGDPLPTGGPTSTVPSSPSTVTGLTANTNYDVYVRDVCSMASPLIISAVYDLPLSGGTPKGIELFVGTDIADLSEYGVSSANNGGGTSGGAEFTFPAVSVTAGTYIYVSSESTNFQTYFGFAPDYTDGSMSVNGDDAIELFHNGTVIDVFGDVDTDGSGQAWEYTDGWALRNSNTVVNNGTFNDANWSFSGPNAVDGCSSNSSCSSSLAVGSFTATANVSPWEGPLAIYTGLCTPAPTSVDGIGITNVTMGTIDNTTGAETNNYGDYTAQSTSAAASSTLPIDITLETGYTYNLWAWVDWNGDLDFDDANEEYYLGESTSADPTTFNASIVIPLGATLGSYTIRIGGADSGLGSTSPSDPCYTGSYASFEDYTLIVTAPPSCLAPTQLGATNLTATSADLTWLENGTATAWNIEYDVTGYTQGNGNTQGASNNPYNLTGLAANTTYDFYVQADCGGGDESAWVGPFTFTTECDIYTPNYLSDFSTYLPDCWSEAGSGNTSTGPQTLGTSLWSQSGTSARINLYTDDREDWLLTPEFDLSAGGYEILLSTHAVDYGASIFTDMGSDDSVQVLISTDNGSTWSDIYSFNVNNQPTLTSSVVAIDLSSYTGSSNLFAIRGTDGVSNDLEDYYFYVDQFEIRTIPPCVDPTALSASNITGTSADLAWTENGTATDWNIEYGPTGFTPGSGTTISAVTSNPYTLTGLLSCSDYDFYVESDCGFGNTSAMVGPFAFSTANVAATGTDVQVACETFDWIDGNTYTSSNNTATHTIVGGSVSGCDSIVTLDLTINNATTGTDVQVACETFDWIDGNTYTSSNNTATHTIVGGAANGCDSIVTLDLTINNATTGTDVQVACETFDWIDGNTYTSSNNTATYTLVGGAANGCDSIVTLDLTINTVDASVTQTNGINLSANTSGATYQWIDCDNNNAPISGETSQDFTATVNGNYAVIVTENGCSDTSSCYLVDNVGLSDFDQELGISLYPNPTKGEVNILIENMEQASLEMEVVDATGRKLTTTTVYNKSVVVDLSKYERGVYIIRLTDGEHESIHRVVKN